ncbi:SDR family oxidoreductase [Rhizobium laguerreae]|uniref:SDR family oxidoreductase n=1 Tax=Rhizobium laguerreae TaxID=1076926 RepID=UPI001C912AFD|nr:SDR family oxidoreductase [Rhizobium laguerreae]MBY3135837.1 SDR family oxidoreductase [Rhizobium laguerreae]
MSKVWLITGAGRGMGLDFAKAVLAAGDKLVATGRNPERVAKAIGQSENLLVVTLDVTKPTDADSAVKAALERFGRIDIMVNNAANFYSGYFEELTPPQINLQLASSLLGPMSVTRAVLPVMRRQESGKIISISSTASLLGFEFCSAYSAAKFALDSWMESLQPEVAPFGIETMIVNPGFFRTELLTDESTQYAPSSVSDYDERRAQHLAFWKSASGLQSGDPAKLAQALIALVNQPELPRRFIAGADAVGMVEQKIALLQQQIDAYRDLSSSLAFDVNPKPETTLC